MNTALNMPNIAIQNPIYTYADYARWPDEERWELIDGHAYDMTPAPGLTHQEVVGGFYAVLREHFRGNPCRVAVAPLDVLLPRADEADEETRTVVQPDVLVICDPQKITERYIRGAPDLAVEVLSPGTARKDEGVKRDAYARAGVKEYWLVHPFDHTVNRYVLTDGAYGRPDVFGLGDTLQSSCFPDLTLDLRAVFEVEEEPPPRNPPPSRR